jgi:hypothetical protein
MSKWEYKWLNIVYTPPFNAVVGNNYELVTNDARMIPAVSRPKKTEVMEAISQLGEAGWELISVHPIQTFETSSSRTEFHLFFRRPLAE